MLNKIVINILKALDWDVERVRERERDNSITPAYTCLLYI